MSVAAGGTLMRVRMRTGRFAPHRRRRDPTRRKGRHIGVIGTGHGFSSTSAVGVRSGATSRGYEQDGAEYLQHLSLPGLP
jgi:DNA/RNA endonuclease YhcR with UshA esterase domain